MAKREPNTFLQTILNLMCIYLKAPSQKKKEKILTKQITKLVEKVASEHYNAHCCLSFIGSKECSITLRFKQHCLLLKCCPVGQDPITCLAPRHEIAAAGEFVDVHITTVYTRRANKHHHSLQCCHSRATKAEALRFEFEVCGILSMPSRDHVCTGGAERSKQPSRGTD